MKPAIEISLVLSVVTGLSYLFVKSTRKWAGRLFLVALTAFVAVAFSSVPRHQSFKEATVPAFEVDQSELSLRMLTAFRAAQGSRAHNNLRNTISAAQYHGAPVSDMLVKQVYAQVISSLAGRVSSGTKTQTPESHKLNQGLAELIIVCSESGDESYRPKIYEAAEQLSSTGDSTLRQLSHVLLSIYTIKHLGAAQAQQFEHVLQSKQLTGWYRNQARLRLLSISGQTKALAKLKATTDAEAISFARRIIALLTVIAIAALIGIITILIFLATESRVPRVEQSTNIPWSLTTTYGVLMGWLATQLIAQSILVGSPKDTLKHALQAGSSTTAAVTAVIYLITTGPALLYIWWFACRPFGIQLQEAVRLRFKTKYAGFPKLVATGILSWCAAIPVVLGCQLLAMKLFSSQGSTNPVLSLVRDAAHCPSVLPITIYFIILGVLAPLMEEALFRGFIYSSLRTKFGKLLAAVGSAALFATAHFDPGAFISLFALGFIFALVFERYQSILPSMIAHGLWNCGTFTLVLVMFGGD